MIISLSDGLLVLLLMGPASLVGFESMLIFKVGFFVAQNSGKLYDFKTESYLMNFPSPNPNLLLLLLT